MNDVLNVLNKLNQMQPKEISLIQSYLEIRNHKKASLPPAPQTERKITRTRKPKASYIPPTALTQEETREIAKAYEAGMVCKQIAKKFKVAKGSIHSILANAGIELNRTYWTQTRKQAPQKKQPIALNYKCKKCGLATHTSNKIVQKYALCKKCRGFTIKKGIDTEEQFKQELEVRTIKAPSDKSIPKDEDTNDKRQRIEQEKAIMEKARDLLGLTRNEE